MPTIWPWFTSRPTAATGIDPLGRISSNSRNGWLEVTSREGVAVQLWDQGRQLVAGLVPPARSACGLGKGLLQQLHQGRGREEVPGLVLLHNRHSDGNGQVGLAHPAGAKKQQFLGLLQPGLAAGEHLQFLPVLALQMLVIKTPETLLLGIIWCSPSTAALQL